MWRSWPQHILNELGGPQVADNILRANPALASIFAERVANLQNQQTNAAGRSKASKKRGNKQHLPPPAQNANQAQPAHNNKNPATGEQDDNIYRADEEVDEEEAQKDVYKLYRPAKVTEGNPHPTDIVETASLSSVTPPDITYQHHLQDIVSSGLISNAQLETVLYAMMRFNQRLEDGSRAGFFLGDGAGVGKGRQIAALIKEFWASGGRRILWVSTSQDLRFDAVRDLTDVGAGEGAGHAEIPIYPKGKGSLPSGNLHAAAPCGVVFVTYSLLVGRSMRWEEVKPGQEPAEEQQPILSFMPSSSGATMALDGPAPKVTKIPKVQEKSRLKQMIDWLRGRDKQGDCLIVFDECHKAKNLVPEGEWSAGGNKLEGSLTGWAVETLQKEVANARILYSSATGATEPRNMMYMTRLGTAGFKSMHDLITSLDSAGLGALELYCMGLKSQGTYLSRSLSYAGAEFDMHRVEIKGVTRITYDRATEFWLLLLNVLMQLRPIMDKHAWGLFWSAHQRFFRQMLIAAKVPDCARLAIEAVAAGQCAVIGLQSTGEANTTEVRAVKGDTLEDLVSAPKAILKKWVGKWFPTHNRTSKKKDQPISEDSLDVLQAQVSQAMQAWKQKLPALQEAHERVPDQAACQSASPSPGKGHSRIAPHLARRVKAEPLANQAGSSRHGASGSSSRPEQGRAAAKMGAGASAAAVTHVVDLCSDDDVLVAVEKDLDDVLQERRLAAMRTGNLLDLTEHMDREELQSTLLAMEEDDAAAAAAVARRKREEEDRAAEERRERLRAEVREAEAALDKMRSAQHGSVASAGRSKGDGSPAHPMLVDSSDDEDFAIPRRTGRGRRAGTTDAVEAMDCSFEEQAPQQTFNRLRRKRSVLADSDEDSDEELGGARRKRSSPAASAPAVMTPTAATGKQAAGARCRVAVLEEAQGQASLAHSASPADIAASAPGGEVAAQPAGTSAAAASGAADGGRAGGSQRPVRAARSRRAAVVQSDSDEAWVPSSDEDELTSPYKPAKKLGKKQQVAAPAPAVEEPSVEASDGEEDDTACELCGAHDSEEHNSILLCDLCDLGYHQHCLTPKVMEVPEGDWYCPGCTQPDRKTKAKGSERRPRGCRTPHEARDDSGELENNSAWAAQHVPAPNSARPPLPPGRPDDKESLKTAMLALAARKRVEDAKARLAALDAKPTLPLKAIKAESEPGCRAARRSTRGAAAEAPTYSMDRLESMQLCVKHTRIQDNWDKEIEEGLDPDFSEAEDADTDEDEAPQHTGPQCRQLLRIQKMLLRLVEALELPANPLDQLIDLLGGEDKVAEMTGRKGGLVRTADGKAVVYKQRGEETGTAQKMLNIEEQRAFMEGRKLIAIISEAASTGISLQADKRVANTRRRCHLTLELPWSADKAIQQFGRSHRSNQDSSPIYRLVVAQCGGEYRFAAAVAKRLLSLGALLKGDRRALDAGSELKDFDVDNKWGKNALQRLIQDITNSQNSYSNSLGDLERLRMPGMAAPRLPRDKLDPSDSSPPLVQCYRHLARLLVCMGIAEPLDRAGQSGGLAVSKKPTVATFLNRLLGLALADQELIFGYFWDTLEGVIKAARSEGKYDDGITTLPTTMAALQYRQLLHTDTTTGAKTWHTQVAVDWGLSWQEAMQVLKEHTQADATAGRTQHPRVGICKDARGDNWFGSGHPLVALIVEVRRSYNTRYRFFRVIRPSHRDKGLISEEDMMARWDPIRNLDRAKAHWDHWFQYLGRHCAHGPNCQVMRRGEMCDYGMRIKTLPLMTGAVLPLWRVVDDYRKSTKKPLYVKRIMLQDGEPLVGLMLDNASSRTLTSKVEMVHGPAEDNEDCGGLPPAAYERP